MGAADILHHQITGPEGAPVLLLSGSLGTNLSMWRPQAQALSGSGSGEFRVIAFDQRGHGRSFAPAGPYTIAELGQDVLTLMDSLGVEQASFCGLSIGGMIGIWLAANAPERLARLVLICTSAYAPPESRWSERAYLVRQAKTVEPVADAVVERWFTPGWAQLNPHVVAEYRGMLATTDPEGYASCCEAIAAMDLRAELPRILLPTLVISGAEDLALPPEHQRLIAERIPGARLASVRDAAHIPTAQHPETVNRLIREHLTQ